MPYITLPIFGCFFRDLFQVRERRIAPSAITFDRGMLQSENAKIAKMSLLASALL